MTQTIVIIVVDVVVQAAAAVIAFVFLLTITESIAEAAKLSIKSRVNSQNSFSISGRTPAA